MMGEQMNSCKRLPDPGPAKMRIRITCEMEIPRVEKQTIDEWLKWHMGEFCQLDDDPNCITSMEHPLSWFSPIGIENTLKWEEVKNPEEQSQEDA